MTHRMRVAGYAIGGVLAVILLIVSGVYGFSARDFNRTYDVEPAPLELSRDWPTSELVARGEHLAHIRGCAECHHPDGGGMEFADDPAFGLLWTSNLTRGEGGIAAEYTDQDWDRSIRHGVGPDGKPLMFMPSHEYWPMSDDDIAALVAYYRDLPPVDRVRPDSRPGPLARVLHLTGALPLVPARLVDHSAERPPAPAEGPTVAFGGYLATGCMGCHGAGFSGGKITGGDPSWPAAANLTPDMETGIGSWSLNDMVRALRQGIRPDGSAIDPAMPIQATKHLTDVEIEALYNYFMSLEPAPYGNR